MPKKVSLSVSLSLLTVLTVFIFGCGEDESNGTIYGKVICGEGIPDCLGGFPGGPISGVTVSVLGLSRVDVTNDGGVYVINDVPAGRHKLRAKLFYMTVGEVEVDVEVGEVTIAPEIAIIIPPLFLGGWRQLGFYDTNTGEYVGDECLIMGPDPTIRRAVKGELIPLIPGTYLDNEIELSISMNYDDSTPLELRKNMFSYQLDTMLPTGKNVIVIKATNPRGRSEIQLLNIYYYPFGLVVTLRWEGAGDLDLHLTGPDGTDCSYDNTNPDWGIMEESMDNPQLHHDRRTGWLTGGETIGLLKPPPGRYTVGVNFFGYRYQSFSEAPTRPVVTVYIDGKVYAFTAQKPMHLDDEWLVTSFIWPGEIPKAYSSSN
jgi:hypothetical protein